MSEAKNYLNLSFLKRSVFYKLVFLTFFSIGLASCSKEVSIEPTLLPEKPDFANIKEVKEKKKVFFNYFHALVSKANENILAEREVIQTIETKLKTDSSLTDKKLVNLCTKYKVDCDSASTKHTINQLLHHIDIIPSSLALAQAANESAWGTSRFALKANNYFGQWCFTKGCGLVPERRNEGAKHEVRKFDSAYESVEAYIFNLNTNRAYKPLREYRETARNAGKNISGIELVKGLTAYSERGSEYIKELQSMIRHNDLAQYDSK